MSYRVIRTTQISTPQTSNISNLIASFSVQLQELYNSAVSFESLRSIDGSAGKQLDLIGDIVSLSRREAGVMISDAKLVQNDDVYRMLIKYKALKNTTFGSVSDVLQACKILFNPVDVVYAEMPSRPATFFVTVTAKFTDTVLSVINTHNIMVKPAGVQAVVTCTPAEFFGFSDLNNSALGFGVGTFAQSIQD